jgi:hypothetical protein
VAGTNDREKAKAFYDVLLDMIGMKPFFEYPSGGRPYGIPNQAMFAVLPPFDGEDARPANGSMAGFGVGSRAKVDEVHAQALELGATTKAIRIRGAGKALPLTSPTFAISMVTSSASIILESDLTVSISPSVRRPNMGGARHFRMTDASGPLRSLARLRLRREWRS